MQHTVSFLRLVPWVVVSGCGILSPGDCVAIGRSALHVIVSDSTTGAAPVNEVRVIARDGEYADSANIGAPHASGLSFSLAVEREGTYLLTVDATGYRSWAKAGITVGRSSDKCQYLQSKTVLARLQR